MSGPSSTLETFRRSCRSHFESAQHVLGRASAAGSHESHVRPCTAAYLAHVALECVLKAHLLYRGGCASVGHLQSKNPSTYSALFQGRRGHNLQVLADKLGLPRLLRIEGKAWVDDECWKRISSDARPYSLRYGEEDVSCKEVEQELKRAHEIITAVLSQTERIPLTAARSRTRRK
jgi:hypothetical protein